MKAKTVRYEVVKSDGNWGNTRVGIELELEEGERAQDALEKARLFVQKNLPDPGFAARLRHAELVLADPDNYTGLQLKQAREVVESVANDEDIPF